MACVGALRTFGAPAPLTLVVRPHKRTMDQIDLIIALVVYGFGLVVAQILRKKEDRERPEKLSRYNALPLGYRLACPLIVIPLFTGAPVLLHGQGHSSLASFTAIVLAPIALLLTESAAMRWYRKAGLL